jgi:putative transposase
MKRSRFSEEQIIAILREQEAGSKTVEVCRRHGVSEATFYKWKAKYGGMEVSDARRLKAPEGENAKLKRLLAEYPHEKSGLADRLRLSGAQPDSRPSFQWTADPGSPDAVPYPFNPALIFLRFYRPDHTRFRFAWTFCFS